MFCKNCGKPVEDGSKFCSNCGSAVSAPVEEVSVEAEVVAEPEIISEPANETFVGEPINPVKDKIVAMFSGNLFLTLSILVSAAAFFGLCVGGFDVIKILLVIFCWLAFAAAKKNELKTSHIKNISGTFYAITVCAWVIVGICGLLAVVAIVGSSSLVNLLGYGLEYADLDFNFGYMGSVALIVAVIIAFAVIIGVVIVMNIGYITVHKFLKSLYKSYDSGSFSLEKTKSASGWILAFGIISGVGALSSVVNFLSFLASGSVCAAWIILYVLMKKTFENVE